MINYLLDTNIVVGFIRDETFKNAFEKKYYFPDNRILISVVTVGEIYALAIKWNWGKKKKLRISRLLNDFLIYPIRVQKVITAYAEIDAYSQGKLPNRPLPFGMTARNMGKNDLWIAATANVLDAALLTTDKDFLHLDNTFLILTPIEMDKFK